MKADLTYLESMILYSIFKNRTHFAFTTKPLRESNAVPYRIEQTIEHIESKVGKKLIVTKPKSVNDEGNSFDNFSNKNVEKYLGRRYAGQR
jgi:predicted phosphoribosyltransferase